MALRPEQLRTHLDKGSLAPVYLLAGDEPLQLQEAADALRQAAREQAYTERSVLQVETGFDWGQLHAAGANLSLFGDRRLLELRMPGGKPGQAGGRVITDWCAAPPQDTLLLILCGRLDGAQRRAGWFRAIERTGQTLLVWPMNMQQMQRWVSQRLQAAELQPEPGAAAVLAERSEGNLLAASQEIEKLRLLQGPGPVSLETVSAAVADSARNDVFDLAQAAFSGESVRVLRVARRLQAEGAEPVLALWALAAGVRAAGRMRRGQPAREALQQNRVFGDLARAVEQGVRRQTAAQWESLLGRCARVDRVIKGAGPGRVWSELVDLSLAVSGGPAMQEQA